MCLLCVVIVVKIRVPRFLSDSRSSHKERCLRSLTLVWPCLSDCFGLAEHFTFHFIPWRGKMLCIVGFQIIVPAFDTLGYVAHPPSPSLLLALAVPWSLPLYRRNSRTRNWLTRSEPWEFIFPRTRGLQQGKKSSPRSRCRSTSLRCGSSPRARASRRKFARHQHPRNRCGRHLRHLPTRAPHHGLLHLRHPHTSRLPSPRPNMSRPRVAKQLKMLGNSALSWRPRRPDLPSAGATKRKVLCHACGRITAALLLRVVGAWSPTTRLLVSVKPRMRLCYWRQAGVPVYRKTLRIPPCGLPAKYMSGTLCLGRFTDLVRRVYLLMSWRLGHCGQCARAYKIHCYLSGVLGG